MSYLISLISHNFLTRTPVPATENVLQPLLKLSAFVSIFVATWNDLFSLLHLANSLTQSSEFNLNPFSKNLTISPLQFHASFMPHINFYCNSSLNDDCLFICLSLPVDRISIGLELCLIIDDCLHKHYCCCCRLCYN